MFTGHQCIRYLISICGTSVPQIFPPFDLLPECFEVVALRHSNKIEGEVLFANSDLEGFVDLFVSGIQCAEVML